MIAAEMLASLEEGDLLKRSLALLDDRKIPKHVAIIMDGNRRWAFNANMPAMAGHWEGAEVLTEIVRFASDLGVKTMTVFAFSTENWGRSQEEIEALMSLFELFLISKREMMIREGIRLGAIGDLSRLPPHVRSSLQDTMDATRASQKIHLVLALNYGARDEIRRAVQRILERHDEKRVLPQELTEEFFAQHLDTHQWGGDPDLLIRTSGELRVSNFLLWQISYAELYVTDVLWPDFTPKQFLEAILAYQARHRRQGG